MTTNAQPWPFAANGARQLADVAVDLDCSATMPLDPAVRIALAELVALDLGNPSSTHGKGQAARKLVEWGRHQLAGALGVAPQALALTSGATEANALAWRGILDPLLAAGGRPVVLTSAVEHASVRALATDYRKRGVVVLELPVDGCGRWRMETLSSLLAGAPLAFASLIWVNNETGVVHPVSAVAHAARQMGAVVHCDATQTIGRLPLDLAALGVDLLTLSGHKFGAPAGIGALWVRPGAPITAVQPGHQELGVRGGTENLLGAVGIGVAAAALSARLTAAPRVRQLRDQLAGELLALDAVRNADVAADDESGHIINVSFAGIDAPRLVMALDLAGVAASAGSACASGTLEPSHVQLAMHGDSAAGQARARGALRFSLGPHHGGEEVGRAATIVAQVVGRLRDGGHNRHW